MATVGGVFAGIGALAKGMGLTFKTMFAKPVTLECSTYRNKQSFRFVGRPVLSTE